LSARKGFAARPTKGTYLFSYSRDETEGGFDG